MTNTFCRQEQNRKLLQKQRAGNQIRNLRIMHDSLATWELLSSVTDPFAWHFVQRFVVNRASNSLIPGRVIELSSVQRKPTNDCVTKKKKKSRHIIKIAPRTRDFNTVIITGPARHLHSTYNNNNNPSMSVHACGVGFATPSVDWMRT